jgi:hypothetical protein
VFKLEVLARLMFIKIVFHVDGYTPNAQVSLCGAPFEFCDGTKVMSYPHQYWEHFFRLLTHYCPGKPSVYLLILPGFYVEDSFELHTSHRKLQMDSTTEGHL